MLDIFGYIQKSVNKRELGYYHIWVYSRATLLPCSYWGIIVNRPRAGSNLTRISWQCPY